jgi:hypothetical protein
MFGEVIVWLRQVLPVSPRPKRVQEKKMSVSDRAA